MINNLDEKSAKATFSLLCNLFSDLKYDENEKLFCEYICHNSVENFINREIFTNGLIRIGLSQNLNSAQKLFCHIAAAYFLHCRYNAKLDRCEQENYKLKAIDFFLLYDVLCSFASQNYSEWERCDRTFLKAEKFFEQLQRSSVCFVSPSNLCYTWSGSDYISGKEDCFQIELLVKGHADRMYKTYEDYVKYLLSEERNSIYSFRSSCQLWDNATELTKHRHEANYIENYPTKDKELLFVLSLGLDKDVLTRLNNLRKKNASPMSHIGENEIQALESYLEKINEYLAAVKNTESDPRKIPRRMLLNANIYLLKLGFKPIIPLFDDEIDELNTLLWLRGMRNTLKANYFGIVDEKGRRTWTFQTHELLINESVRLLINGQPPMVELTSEEIDGFEKMVREKALCFYDRIYDEKEKKYRWIIKRGVQLTPNNTLNI